MNVKVLKPSQIPQEMYNSIVGLDIETEDLFLDSPICMVSLYKPGNDYIVVVLVKMYNDEVLITMSDLELEIFKKYLSSIRAVGHNLQFDLAMIKYQWGVAVEPYFDTFVYARIRQMRKQSLKDIVMNLYPSLHTDKFDDVQDIQKPPFRYYMDDRTIEYSALDAYYPFLIIQNEKDNIQKDKKIVKLEMDYLKCAISMKSNGLRVDVNKFNVIQKKYNKSVEDKQVMLNSYVGYPVRINSSRDLTELLINRLHLESSVLTPKGSISMSAESRKQMYENTDDPIKKKILGLISELKHDFSVMNSMKKVPTYIVNQNNVSKLTFNIEQIGFDGTSRVYSRDTSVNQLPKEFREAIIPSPGKKFVMFDWSSAELYIAAYWSKCKKILDWYNSSADLHTEISKLILGVDFIDKEMRKISKVISFSTIYGSEGGAASEQLNITFDEAKDLVKKYFELFPEIRDLRGRAISYCHVNGCTSTLMGRKRRIPEIFSNSTQEVMSAERKAFNTAIQGSCADFFKLATIKVRKYQDRGVVYKFGVFDSHLLEVPQDMSLEEATEIAKEISDFSDLYQDFRFKFKIAEGKNWLECQNQL